MASGKSKYIVADKNTYNNVGATVGQGQTKIDEEQLKAMDNFASTSQVANNETNIYPQTSNTDIPSLNYQPVDYNNNFNSVEQPMNYQPTNYNSSFNPVEQPINDINYQNNYGYQQPADNNIMYQNIQQNSNEQMYPYNNQPMDYSSTYQTNQPVVNEFIENQTNHVSADQLLDDYGLNNVIRAEDDNYNFNIDDQITNSQDIYYNGSQFNNNLNEPQIIINHQNLDYQNTSNNNVHTNSFTKKGQYIPPQRTLNNKKKNKAHKKMRRNHIFINILLFFIYILIFGTVGYLGYKYYINQQQFFTSCEEVKIVQGASFEETIYIKTKVQKNENYTFKSEDENIATVDANGIITAVSVGKTTINITSKDEKHTGKVIVEVISSEIKSFKLEQEEKKMYIDGTYTIIPLINGEKDVIVSLNYKSSDENILTVSDSGIVTAHKTGIAEVIVSIPNTKYKAKVLIQVKK